MLVVAQKQTTSEEILLWKTPSKAPKACTHTQLASITIPKVGEQAGMGACANELGTNVTPKGALPPATFYAGAARESV